MHAAFNEDAFQAGERPYINICPCDIDPAQCKKSNIFIDIIDDECHGEAAMASMEAATESDYSKRLDYAQTKMKFMFDNEESLAETSEMLVQQCYSKLKHAGIVSCKVVSSTEIPSPNRHRRAIRSSQKVSVVLKHEF